MDFQRSLCVFLVIFAATICCSEAYRFNVGGRDGWVLNPSENYNQWSGRMRFLINDTLHFRYNQSSNSVLVVSRDDYDKCNTENPIVKLEGGDSEFKLDRSGPFYFITGNKSNCDNGQKLIVVVLSMRRLPTPSAAPPMGQTPPPMGQTSPPMGQTSPPMGQTPATAPPMAETPTVTPVSPSTELSPSPAPETDVPSLAPPDMSPSSPSSGVSPSSISPSSTSPSSSPASSPGGRGPSSGSTPADVTSPAPNGSSAPATTPSVVFVTLVSLVISVVLASFIA